MCGPKGRQINSGFSTKVSLFSRNVGPGVPMFSAFVVPKPLM